jgi:hypothetical protein
MKRLHDLMCSVSDAFKPNRSRSSRQVIDVDAGHFSRMRRALRRREYDKILLLSEFN